MLSAAAQTQRCVMRRLELDEQLQVEIGNICFFEYRESVSCDLRMVCVSLHSHRGRAERRAQRTGALVIAG
jgi:hypothetical protein